MELFYRDFHVIFYSLDVAEYEMSKRNLVVANLKYAVAV